MKNLFDSVRLGSRIAASLVVVVSAMTTPHALAHDKAAERIKQLEQSLQAIQAELQKIKSESSQAAQKVNSIEQKTNQTVQKVNSLEESKAAFMERTDLKTGRMGQDVTEKTRMLFFRGGFAHMMNHRDGVTIQNQVLPIGMQDQADKQGWYAGAGID